MDLDAQSERAGSRFFKPLRQLIESINDTLKGQLDLEQHGGRTPTGVLVRVCQPILAMTAAIWHNDHIGARIKRSLTARTYATDDPPKKVGTTDRRESLI